MPARPVTVRRTTADDWQHVRDLRLAMLADTPIAYGEKLAVARRHAEAEWRMRAARGEAEHGTSLVAIDDGTGDWVGAMGGFLQAPGQPLLVGVYVAPTHRGRSAGVTDLLLDGVEAWAATEGDVLRLHVHEQNERAIAFYRRRGYEPTGHTNAYALDPTAQELEMLAPLR